MEEQEGRCFLNQKEKWVATYTSVLAWEIPWIEEPGRLQSMGSQRVRHDLATKQKQLNYSANEYCTAN